MRLAPFIGTIITITVRQIMIFSYVYHKPYTHLHQADRQIWVKRRNVTHSWQRMEVE